jgi:ATP-dependent Clp protease ATP-binding subunit ClpB
LLGVLDKATLTLGENRRVDFSRTLIFMTSNIGAAEMGSILRPNLGFAASEVEKRQGLGQLDASTVDKISRAGLAPEFMNRIDKVVVFKPLGQVELRKILEIELSIIKEAENMPANAMLHMMGESVDLPVRSVSMGAMGQIPSRAARGRRSPA